MNRKETEEYIISSYQRDENMMILVFAQWCVNQDIDPIAIYHRAYPDQATNTVLKQAMELTVPKEESEDIPFETLMSILSLFGNDDLAFVVSDEFNKLVKSRTNKNRP